MRQSLAFVAACMFAVNLSAQNKDTAKIDVYPKGKGFYYETILKDISHVNDSLEAEAPATRLTMDQSGYDLPNKVSLYKREWANPVISQGNTGTCWDFSTLSMYESEIFRMTGKKVKLSEMFVAYNEYLAKAKRFIEERGNSLFDEGSEGNAVARIALACGLMPETEYTGLINGRKYHDHSKMMEEMSAYLNSLKTSNAWNEKTALETIASIMNHYMGVPPTSFVVDGKEYTPMSYMKDYLKLDPNDFVEILSYKQKPYWQKVEYTVPDNWWHNADYYNVPLDVYMDIVKKAIREGYTMSIGGDVSEAGFARDTQCAMVPDFDIPSAYINDDSRAFRFDNETTTDDHGMHLVGYLENYNKDGKDWYLIKDSSSGSRNNDPSAAEFGYYFFSEDYVKLKMMGFTIHKDAVKDILKKFK
ncbi:C1 family peptidase [Mangrovibacterium diazotrophicum]|uniref:Bleomycin hydrolase n=1 Tax=Mangrovibacterium diazotrophicum TaxID=1261403 RepID=A0A419W2I2_9BACT|nr:C1 family peptidase [Mangrovibacterium diazotrophicum]RKD89695.1 bleomycin hydrolase [Mangrovibacterium diazotrophicum]